ncbi:MAG: hypothetical protein NC299_05895 [Lachnospiraceae bacterium]|nr:hypothetical protein [Ruminococcus sp.]MCM1274884.1 hypothetical protein [Lachnospiraceae bacterium]
MRNKPYFGYIVTLAVFIVLMIQLYALLFSLFGAGRTQCYALNAFVTACENAPEGAVRIEPLIRLPESDGHYVPSDRDTELARYSENGYVSLSAHFDGCRLSDNEYALYTADHILTTELIKRYGAFKAAYVDENENVLGVTDTARIKSGNAHTPQLAANGNRLTYHTGEMSGFQCAILLILPIVELLAVSALAVLIILSAVGAVRGRIRK